MSEKTVIVAGSGGNIGSHIVPHLGRMDGVERVMLIDRDRYERKNLNSQDITRADLDRPKAVVQAERLGAIHPAIKTEAVVDDVMNVPLGKLRGLVILGCLDNNAARQYVSEVAWHLGVPFIDAGVIPDAGQNIL